MKYAAIIAMLLLGASPALAQDQAVPLTGAPTVTEAPGKGIQPHINSSTMAMLYMFDNQPFEQISPLIQRQYLSGSQSTIVKWTVKKGAVFALHHHANEQITWITKGRCEVSSQGKKYIVTAGMVLVIPPNVPHEFLCTEDTIDIDFFAPQRQDFIEGATPAYAAGH
jgi:quercetin dioxygenase-like cupin family protein